MGIPAKYARKHFDSVAQILGQALKLYPQTYLVQFNANVAETLARKLREARIAKNTYNYSSPFIDELLWKTRASLLMFVPNGDAVLITNAIAKQGEVTTPIQPFFNGTTVEIGSLEQLEILCQLIQFGVFKPRPQWLFMNVTQEQITQMEQRYDVGFQEEQGGFLLI